MQKYQDVVLKVGGGSVPYAQVTVQAYPAGTTSTIYSDNGSTTQTNPITCDANGAFSFYAGDGRYQLVISGTGITTKTVTDILLDDTANSTQVIAVTLQSATPVTMANAAIRATGSVDSTFQIDVRNASATANASSDIVATASNGTDATNFVNFGINSSAYAVGTWTINGASDGYLYTSDTALSIGTAANKELNFFTGGTLLANRRMLISGIGDVVTSVNTAVPALTVNGQMVFALTSNTNLRVTVRGSDGITRAGNITLA
jgi:hypothetical protein